MSESRPHSPHHDKEHHKKPEVHTHSPEHLGHEHHKKPEKHSDGHEASTHDLESIQKSIEAHAKSSAETRQPIHESDNHAVRHYYVNNELKKMSFERTMVRIRKTLSPAERVFSKVIHQPAIDELSELGAKTVARPPALLGGGVFALVGSVGYYWISRHYGYEYNFSVFLIFLTAGLIAGLLLEFTSKLLSGRRH